MGYSEITYCSLKNRVYNIPPRRVEALKILSVSFIQDVDLVGYGINDSIAFAEDGSTVILKAAIPQGSYSLVNFPGAVAAAMSSAGTQQYVVTYSDVTRRLTIATTGSKNFKILPGERGGTPYSTAYQLIGMSRYEETGPGKSFVMKNSMNLSQSAPLLLTSNIAVKGSHYLSDFNDSADTNVLCSITPDSINDVVSWTNDGEFMACDEMISALEFHLLDSQTFQEVSLNSALTVRIAFSDDVADYSNR